MDTSSLLIISFVGIFLLLGILRIYFSSKGFTLEPAKRYSRFDPRWKIATGGLLGIGAGIAGLLSGVPNFFNQSFAFLALGIFVLVWGIHDLLGNKK